MLPQSGKNVYRLSMTLCRNACSTMQNFLLIIKKTSEYEKARCYNLYFVFLNEADVTRPMDGDKGPRPSKHIHVPDYAIIHSWRSISLLAGPYDLSRVLGKTRNIFLLGVKSLRDGINKIHLYLIGISAKRGGVPVSVT